MKTDEEYRNFHPSGRTLESCNTELEKLKEIYLSKKADIKDIFDIVIAGDLDPIFNLESQKEFYGDKLRIINNARHNPFFRIKGYKDLLEF